MSRILTMGFLAVVVLVIDSVTCYSLIAQRTYYHAVSMLYADTTALLPKSGVHSALAKRDSLLAVVQRYESAQSVDTAYVFALCGLSYEFLGLNPSRALEYALRAKAVAERLSERTALAYALENIGRAYRVLGLYTLSLEQFLLMLRIGEELHEKRVQMLALRRIGQNYYSERNYAAALEYAQRSLALSITVRDTLEQGQALNNIGVVQRAQEQYEPAMENLRTALEIARKYSGQDPYFLSIVTQNIALVYSQRGEYQEARKHFQQALAMERYLDEFVGMTYCYRGLGRILVKEQKYSEALLYAEKALALADSINIGLEKDATFELLADIHAGLGNAQLALQYYKRSVSLKDSIAGVTSAQKAATLESAFQQEKSDKVRERLEAANQQQAIIRNAVIVVGLLLIVLLGVLLNRYRIKVRSAEQLKIFNDDIQRQKRLLEEQARRIEEINAELQENNIRLVDTNIELDAANTELHSYIEELSHINGELDARNETLNELNREKNEFLGIVAHDLKNPLVAIRLTAEMLQRFSDRMTDSEKADRLNHIASISDRIMAIIDNLLNVNALETGVLAVSLARVNISETIESLEREYKDRAALKSISIRSHLPAAVVFAQADQTMLFTVLENLLSNALKFSPSHTTITLAIQAGGGNDNDDDAKNEARGCRIVVRDEGPGLSENDKTKLFGKFARLSARPTNGEHSTGLGLSIVKKMVEAMRGRVWCESELGKGATFVVELPRA